MLWYTDLIQKTNQLSLHRDLFRVQDIYSLYPELVSITCGKEKCKSPYIEMTDFKNDLEYIKTLPTILIIAGIHGNEVTGTNAIFRLFDLILKDKHRDPTWNNVLQNLRVIFLPLVNPNGYYNKTREETQIVDSKPVKIDPNRDFNWDKPEKCFATLAGQMINHVFKDNLVLGTLTFHGGTNNLTFPWGTFVHLKHSFSPDHVAFENVVEMLKSSAGQNKSLNIIEYQTGTMEELVYDVKGGYEDWAYGASFEPKNLHFECLSKESRYTRSFLESEPNTNRAFVYLIEAGKEKMPREGTLGNELAAVDKSQAQAVVGNVSRNMLLIKQFLEVMRPFVQIQSISLGAAELDQGTLSLVLDVKGCRKVDSVQMIVPSVLNQAAKIENGLFIENTQSNLVKLDAQVDLRNRKWTSSSEIELRVECDGSWIKSNKKYGEPQSHFFRAKSDPHFEVRHKEFTLGSINLRSVKIRNVDWSNLENASFCADRYNEIRLTYHPQFYVKIENTYPLILSFDGANSEPKISVNRSSSAFFNSGRGGHIDNLTNPILISEIKKLVRRKDPGVSFWMDQSFSYVELNTNPNLVKEEFRAFYNAQIKSSFEKNLNQSKSTEIFDFENKVQTKFSVGEFNGFNGKTVKIVIKQNGQRHEIFGVLVKSLNIVDYETVKITESGGENRKNDKNPKIKKLSNVFRFLYFFVFFSFLGFVIYIIRTKNDNKPSKHEHVKVPTN